MFVDNFETNQARGKIIAPSSFSRRSESERMCFDLEKLRSKVDVMSPDLKVKLGQNTYHSMCLGELNTMGHARCCTYFL